MEQLNRSLSKLKPPSTIVRSNSSSTLSTALAVAAAAMNENENYSATTFFGNRSIGATTGAGTGIGMTNESKKDHTLTLEMLEPLPPKTVAGVKRKAEDDPRARPSRAVAASSTRPAPNTRGTIATTTGAARRLNGPTAGTQRQQQPTITKPAGRTPLQTKTRPTGRTTPAIRPTTTAKTTSASTKTGPITAAGRTTTTTTPTLPAGGRARAVPSAKSKAGSSRPIVTRATSRSQSTTPAPGALTAQPKGAGKAVALSTDIELPAKKKRAAWDTKGRLQDMEELTGALHGMLNKSTGNITEITQTLEINANKIEELESFRLGLESKVVGKEIENNDMLQKMSTVEQEIFMLNRKHLDNMKALRSQQAMEVDQEKSTEARLQQERDMEESNLRIANNHLEQQIQESANLRTTISTQSSNCLAFETDNRALKLKIERTEDAIARRETIIEELERKLNDSETQARKRQQKVKDEETSRRKLYGTIMDLKGHIRVFCRVRPNGITDGAVTSIDYPDLEGREIVLTSAEEPKYPFTFDRVFAAASTQEDLFEDVSQMLPSILTGGSACVFAYGSTWTGKSYTLEGPPGSAEESMGLTPRSILQIFEATRAPESNDWKYTLEVRHIGIYNETIYDLHAPEGSPTSTTHEIQSDSGGKVTLIGINMMELKSAVMIGSLLRIAQRRQTVIKTSLKDNYRGGHRVFTICVTGVNSGTGKTTEGTLHFVDLVASDSHLDAIKDGSGSKDSDKTLVGGRVDQSLKCLGDVFVALSNNAQAPYRGSKLTHLLQSSFVDGNNTKMLFIVHISPLSVHLDQTLRSLRFAAKVNSCLLPLTGSNPSISSSAPSSSTPSSSMSSLAKVPLSSTSSSTASSSAGAPPRRIKAT